MKGFSSQWILLSTQTIFITASSTNRHSMHHFFFFSSFFPFFLLTCFISFQLCSTAYTDQTAHIKQ
jgi:hypothetical protein